MTSADALDVFIRVVKGQDRAREGRTNVENAAQYFLLEPPRGGAAPGPAATVSPPARGIPQAQPQQPPAAQAAPTAPLPQVSEPWVLAVLDVLTVV